MSATGYCSLHLPEGPERDKALGLIRIGLKFFQAQRCGRRLDAITKYITGLVKELPQPSFANLLERLDLEAARREAYGERASPTEKVDRVWQLVTLHHPRRGRIQITFATLRTKLSAAKRFPAKPKP